MRPILKMNKKGADIPSILFAIVLVFIIGILLLFSNRLVDELYSGVDKFLNDSGRQNTEVDIALGKIHNVENSVWDYVFLAAVIGVTLQLLLFSFATRISVVFYWLFAIVAIVAVVLGVLASNMWQSAAEQPTFSTTIERFPITNFILGSYFPVFIVALLFVAMIILFGKTPGGQT